jgi:hypothetical protein
MRPELRSFSPAILYCITKVILFSIFTTNRFAMRIYSVLSIGNITSRAIIFNLTTGMKIQEYLSFYTSDEIGFKKLSALIPEIKTKFYIQKITL